MQHSNTRRIVYLGLMIGLAMGLHVFESLIPMPVPIPGAKLGLANIISLYVVMNLGVKDGVTVAILRTILGSLISGTFMTITFYLSFSGGVVSALIMGLTYKVLKQEFSVIGISLLGAVTHNVTQILVASLMFAHIGFFSYLPYMLFFALPTGVFVGLVTIQLNKYYTID